MPVTACRPRRGGTATSLLGIQHLVIAVNKMDLMGFSEQRFNEIVEEYRTFATNLQASDIRFVPLSALNGDNVVNRSEQTPWYSGETLIELLENTEISRDQNLSDLRLPVQYVNRPNLDFRGYCGTLAAGVLRPGQAVKALPSGKTSKVARGVTYDGDLSEAYPGQAITVTLEDEIDISRGDWLVSAEADVPLSNTFTADIVWMHETPLTPGKLYDFKLATRDLSGQVRGIEYQVDVNTLEKNKADALELNAIARCEVELTAAIPVDDYRTSPGTGSFIIIDRLTNVTVGAGMIRAVASGERGNAPTTDWAAFERDLNALVRKHFPHWETKDIRELF